MTQPSFPASPVGGRYDIKSWLGAGGMQNVYRATDRLFGRDVALKAPKDGAAVRRFQNSAVLSAKVNHLNVAKTLDYIEDETGNYLIEELVEGADLSQIFPKFLPALPPAICARILHQLSQGLAASHSAGVVHRDLKPSNIMIDGGSTFAGLKITDFGIAKMAEEEIGKWADADAKGPTSSKTVLGAIPYMAPESISNFRSSSFPSDIWGIAAITYELMSGQKPFGGGLLSIAKILAAKPPVKPALIAAPQFKNLGEELFDIILTCLNPSPQSRPTAEQIVDRMEEVCYAVDDYEIGTISSVNNPWWGFIKASSGGDLSYHRDSFYGEAKPTVGERVWYARHPGFGNDRAFPIVKVPAS